MDMSEFNKERWRAHHLRLDGRTDDAIALMKEILEKPIDSEMEQVVLISLAEIFYYNKDRESAERYQAIARQKFPDMTFSFGKNYSSLLDGDSVLPEYLGNLPNFNVAGYARPAGIREFPKTLAGMKSLDEAVDVVLEGYRSSVLFNENSKLITAGSCFATNVRNYLIKRGFGQTEQCNIPDGLDSTFAIRSWIDFALNGVRNDSEYWYGKTDSKIRLYDADRDQTRGLFDQSDGIILTLGLAQVWEDSVTGGVFWRGVPRSIYNENRHRVRMSTLQENLDNVSFIVRTIRAWRADYPIVFTLSPVPLKATFDGSSPIVTDSVSKSTLRVALHEAFDRLRDDKFLFYWPSFEIVRWASSHCVLTPYGGFDGRHVDEDLVDAIIKRFLVLFFDMSSSEPVT